MHAAVSKLMIFNKGREMGELDREWMRMPTLACVFPLYY